MRRRFLPVERTEHFRACHKHPLYPYARVLGLGNHPGSGTFCNDSQDNNNGTLVGYTTAGDTPLDSWSRTLDRACWRMDGSNDSVSVPGYEHYTFPLFSFSCWINFAVLSNYAPIISRRGSAGNGSYDFQLDERDSGKLIWSLYNYGGESETSNIVMVVNTWQHVSLIYDNVAPKFYINGHLVPCGVGATGPIRTVGTATLRFGQNGMADGFVNGKMADALVFSNLLSPDTVGSFSDPANVWLNTASPGCLPQTLIEPLWSRVFHIPYSVTSTAAVSSRRRKFLVMGVSQ